MFSIHVLPATLGDAILVVYGNGKRRNQLLIDSGTAGTKKHIRKRLASLGGTTRTELVVVTHLDNDHIAGLIALLGECGRRIVFDDLWFNGYHHLLAASDQASDGVELGPTQAERLSELLVRQGRPWNLAFGESGESPVVVPDTGPLPRIALPGGMQITLLAPTRKSLTRLRPVWEREVRRCGLLPGAAFRDRQPHESHAPELGAQALPDVHRLADAAVTEDTSPANASSIAFLAEYGKKRALFAGDLPARHLLSAMKRLSPRRPLAVDLLKLSHHGSKTTTTRELLERLSCKTYVFSTNGAVYSHPDPETVSRVILDGGNGGDVLLAFNYRTPTTEVWNLRPLKERYGYSTVYPDIGAEGLTINL